MRTRALPLVALVAVAGCIPLTPIRRTAFVPGATVPDRVGAALAQGRVRVQGGAGAIRADGLARTLRPLPSVGDPGVFIPDFVLDGSVYVGVGRGLELGLQGAFASLDWAQPNAQGVLAFPTGEVAATLRGGGGLRYDVPLDPKRRIRLSLLTQLDLAAIPEAVFVLEGDHTYAFDHLATQTFLLPNLAVSLGWEPPPAGGVQVTPYLLVGTERSVTNVGFEPDASTLSESTLSGYWFGYLGLGAEVHVDHLVLGTTVNLPFGQQDLIDFGPGVTVSVGFTR